MLAWVGVQKREEPPLPLGGGGSHRRKSCRLSEERPTARNEDDEGEEDDEYEDDGEAAHTVEEGVGREHVGAAIARADRRGGRGLSGGLGRELRHGEDDGRYDAACQAGPADFRRARKSGRFAHLDNAPRPEYQ
mgnify:CR=1 FL=1